MRVCMVAGRYFPDYSGGALQGHTLAKILRSKQIEVRAVTFAPAADGHSPYIQEVVEGVPVCRIITGRASALDYAHRYQRFLNAILQEDFDIIHAHGISYHTYMGALAARLRHKKSLAKLASGSEVRAKWWGLRDPYDPGSPPATGVFARLRAWLHRTATRQVDCLVATTEELVSVAQGVGFDAHRVALIPNGVDTVKFAPASPEERRALRLRLGLTDEQFIVCFSGKIRRVKGIDYLLRVWLRLAERMPTSRLLLIGPAYRGDSSVDLPFAEEVQGLVVNHKAGSTVQFVGMRADVADYLRASDAFVFPSLSEGLPNAVLEAMSVGLPVIATRLPWTTGVIQDGVNGVLFEPGHEDELEASISRLADNAIYRREVGVRARNTVKQCFSLENVADQYIELYQTLVNR